MSTAPIDVAVIGAGPGGSAAAFYLARAGLRTLLVDRAVFPRDKTCGDGLTPRAVAVLDDMGLGDGLSRFARQIDGLRVVAPNGRATSAPIPHHPGLPPYSLVAPRFQLDAAIRGRALQAGAAAEEGVLVQGVDRQRDGSMLVQGERNGASVQYRARQVVVATGAATRLLVNAGLLAGAPRGMVAARAYFADLPPLPNLVEMRFDGVPLPGYGWVFPLADGRANIGAGFLQPRGRRRGPAVTGRSAFDAFLEVPALRGLLAGARQDGPIRAYPLRVDFLTAPTSADGLLVVGEAAGLVNPLTGEGIDYALESGKLAAEHLIDLFQRGGPSAAGARAYDALLHARFDSVFRFCAYVRDWYLNRYLLGWLVAVANRRPDLTRLLIDIGLGNAPPVTGHPLVLLARVAVRQARRAIVR